MIYLDMIASNAPTGVVIVLRDDVTDEEIRNAVVTALPFIVNMVREAKPYVEKKGWKRDDSEQRN